MANETEPTPTEKDSAPVSPFVEAGRIISHVTTSIGIMLVCGGIGALIDRYSGLSFVAFVGFSGGAVLGTWHLIQVTSKD